MSAPLKLRTGISVSHWFVGFHRWPDAPSSVAFLRNLHRHTFYVTATFKVDHADRQLEFFLTQERLREAVYSISEELKRTETLSCEMMAQRLVDILYAWGLDIVRVEVSEDGENSGFVEIVNDPVDFTSKVS